MRKRSIFYIAFFLGFIFLVFRNWFFVPQIIGGDWPFVFQERIIETSLIPPSWNPTVDNGLGGTSPAYFLQSFHHFTFFISTAVKIPWVIVYKIFWFGLFLFFSFFTSLYFIKTIFSKINAYCILIAGLIYPTNTYILMVVNGGQMGVALAYSVAPLVLAVFIKLIHLISSSDINSKFKIQNSKFSVVAGLVLSLQVMFDPRIAYITMIGVVLYLMLNITKKMVKNLHLILFVFVIPAVLAVLLHATWILPILISKQSFLSDLGDAYIGAGIVKFLSFASFSQSFSLLHPNWPENIFGKVGFMMPEFIIIPILAYSSLLFMNSKFKIQNSKLQFKSQKLVLFFALMGLLGAFLAKGANPPSGGIYLWLFENIPGFVMFRDPTKWYTLVVISYSILIPFSIGTIYNLIKSQPKFQISNFKFQIKSKNKIFNFQNLFLLVTVLYLLFLISPAIFGQLGGTFKKHEAPREYVELKNFLYNQKEYFRTLWVPRRQRFSFVSDVHPAIEAEPLFGTRDPKELSKKISSKRVQSLLSEFSVKYVLIPYDSLGELFLDNRKYSEKYRIEYERELDAIPWLNKIQSGKIAVYETPFRKDHFFLSKGGGISSRMIDSMHYVLDISIDQPQILVFSESFNPHWILTEDMKTVPSIKTKNGLNSFWLDQKGKYMVDISFNLEKYYEYGRIISFLTVIILTICLIKLRKKQFDS